MNLIQSTTPAPGVADLTDPRSVICDGDIRNTNAMTLIRLRPLARAFFFSETDQSVLGLSMPRKTFSELPAVY